MNIDSNFTITAIDIMTVLLILVFAIAGYRRGVLKTVISTVGTLLASLMSAVLSKPIAQAIYNGGFKSTIISKTDSAMKLAKQEGGSYIDKLLDTLPNFVANSMKGFHLSSADLTRAGNNGAAQIEKILQPLVVSFLTVIVAGVLFAAFIIVVRVICSVIYRSLDDSPLNFLDALAGGLIAVAEGFIIVILAAFIIRIAVPHMKEVPEAISEEQISESTVFKGIYNSPVLTQFVSAVTDSPNTEVVE